MPGRGSARQIGVIDMADFAIREQKEVPVRSELYIDYQDERRQGGQAESLYITVENCGPAAMGFQERMERFASKLFDISSTNHA